MREEADGMRELLRSAAHDLRNPLSAVVTNLEFAKRLLDKGSGRAAAELVEAVNDSTSACDVLRRIVSNLDVIARGPSGKASIEELSLGPLIREVVARARSAAEQVSVDVSAEIPAESEGARALLDKALFALALENLVANALQYAPRDSSVRVRLERAGGTSRVCVIDGGGAVPPGLRAVAVSPAGNTLAGRKAGSRYGRGMTLLAAAVAADATGVGLELDGDEEESRMTLVIRA
jgi:signal transduction histidine kinase